MRKIKLSRAQIDAVNEAMSHLGDASQLVKMHQHMVKEGHQWKWAALNEITPDDLNKALKFGYEENQLNDAWSVDNLDKYGEVFTAEMLEYLDGTSYRERLAIYKVHVQKLSNGLQWEGYRTFNTISISQMADALGIRKADKIQEKVIVYRRVAAEKSSSEELEADLDYFLASLQHALNKGDAVEIDFSKQRLLRIHREMEEAK